MEEKLTNAKKTLQTPQELLEELLTLRQAVLDISEQIMHGWKGEILPDRADFLESIRNLAHYLALRRHDLRDVQAALRPWGLSSLGRIEAQVMPNIDAVLATLAQLAGETRPETPTHPARADFSRGRELLHAETEAVCGPEPEKRRVRVMVTLPTSAAHDAEFVENLVRDGMDIARINCAHDNPEAWSSMIAHIHSAEQRLGKSCKIAMDLGGPKSRTADLHMPPGHRVQRGERLLLTRDTPNPDAPYAVRVRCTLPQGLEQAQVGHHVWFDDGKVGTVVVERVPEGLVLEVTRAREKGERLREDKGINFPETPLTLDALTEKDLQDLDFVVANADIINYSFVQTPEDVQRLQAEIEKRQPERPIALVAKIETARAIRNLPDLIVAAGKRQPIGVMIARGDLAVEIGFDRLAEMQEEILWICEAAHVPVIWATQVLETLAKKGRPSRAEVSDAAMSERAECVMLNKGPYILDALTILDDILKRMTSHQRKKVSQLRALRSWQ